MKTLFLYYSYSGKTRAIAEKFAAQESADIAKIKEKDCDLESFEDIKA